jgi:hypothetical protein
VEFLKRSTVSVPVPQLTIFDCPVCLLFFCWILGFSRGFLGLSSSVGSDIPVLSVFLRYSAFCGLNLLWVWISSVFRYFLFSLF